MNHVYERWLHVQDRIESACAKTNRSKDEVDVIAVTKYVNTDRIKEAFDAGLRHIGENKAQDVRDKWPEVEKKGIWHFIGHLQSNKVKYIIDKCQYIHSVDRLSLAKEINKQARKSNVLMPCFVQVNVSGEETKQGIKPEQLLPFVEQLADYEHLQVIGLMTMAPFEQDPEQTRPVFHRTKQLQLKLQEKKWSHAPAHHLSMGMSNDFEVAIEEGATYVRIGSALVGR